MNSDYLSPPDLNEIEVSLFGTGDGESVLIHVGDGYWIIVDSCKTKSNYRPIPLKYLDDLHVNTSEKVSLIVISHFHNDHIDGMDKIIEKCPNAKVVIPDSFQAEEFNQLIELYSPSFKNTTGGLGNEVIRETLKIADSDKIILAGMDRKVLNDMFNNNIKCEISCLSPTDRTKKRALKTFAQLYDENYEIPKRLPNVPPNENAIVLWIQFADSTRILLGSDLEEKPPINGWSEILGKSVEIEKTKNVIIYKLPHHGSTTGHHDGVWDELLASDCYLIISGKSSSRLPEKKLIDKLLINSNNIYLSGGNLSKANYKERFVKRRMASISQKTSDKKRNIYDIPKKCSQIRLRKIYNATNKLWDVKLFNNAINLSE